MTRHNAFHQELNEDAPTLPGDHDSDDDRPITILDLATFRLEREPVTGEDFAAASLAIMGGCADCHATIAAYNAHPSKRGVWLCEDCVGDDGWMNVAKADAEIRGAALTDDPAPALPEKQLETLAQQQRRALDAIAGKLTEATALAFSVGIDSVGNKISESIRYAAETQTKVAIRIRREELEGRRPLASSQPCPSCGGPNDHGEECASIYPEIYGRHTRGARIRDHAMDPRD